MSVAKCLAVAVLAVAFGAGATAAEPIKADLKTFKWKPKNVNNEELGGYDEGQAHFFLYTYGSAVGDVEIPEDGEYKITVEASCTEALKEFAKVKLTVGEDVVAKEHALTQEGAKKYDFTAKLKKGKQPLAIEFLNDAFKEGEYDRNLFIQSVTIEKK